MNLLTGASLLALAKSIYYNFFLLSCFISNQVLLLIGKMSQTFYLSTTNNQFHYTPITLDPHQEVITK